LRGVGALSLEEQKTRFHALNDWFLSEHGSKIIEAFAEQLQPLKSLLHGDCLLQLGSTGTHQLLHHFRFQHRWLATPYLSESASLVTALNQLPLDRNSVDCILAPLTLNGFPPRKNPLDEIDRILKPSGYVVFLGINPVSAWGFWLRFVNNNCFGSKLLTPQSVLAIKRIMMHHGYIQCHLSNFYFIPPFRNKALFNHLDILNEVGKMISIVPSGFYCLVMQKHQLQPLTPVPVKPQEIFVPAMTPCN